MTDVDRKYDRAEDARLVDKIRTPPEPGTAFVITRNGAQDLTDLPSRMIVTN